MTRRFLIPQTDVVAVLRLSVFANDISSSSAIAASRRFIINSNFSGSMPGKKHGSRKPRTEMHSRMQIKRGRRATLGPRSCSFPTSKTAYLKTWNITRESSMGNRKVTRFRRLTTVNQQRDGARAEVQLETGSPGFYGRL
ncbi:uncharacterized protein LOC114874076 isoform X1 [Osmia bicornis bicornis]|uniref:uncharacterized protein LOC114874076 isoform X1 n=1 Tax=Osmia bicornis bicornis TaxID=1437191 RepID=UPI0010F880E8|nr:uncharacterized protein LOC114874076 isoform X1 [Osmia bicornis bicornis]